MSRIDWCKLLLFHFNLKENNAPMFLEARRRSLKLEGGN